MYSRADQVTVVSCDITQRAMRMNACERTSLLRIRRRMHTHMLCIARDSRGRVRPHPAPPHTQTYMLKYADVN